MVAALNMRRNLGVAKRLFDEFVADERSTVVAVECCPFPLEIRMVHLVQLPSNLVLLVVLRIMSRNKGIYTLK